MHLSAPPAFHPVSSLLGRALRRRAADARQAEGLYVVAAALVLVGGVLLGQWGWMLGRAHPVAYGVAAGLGWAVIGAACFGGWRPRLHVRVGGGALHIARGAEALVVPLGEVERAERIAAAEYHRHWARYAATRAFVNRLGDEVLLLRTARGPVVLGLGPSELSRLEARLAPAEPRPLPRAEAA
jgi:hypothetical protein